MPSRDYLRITPPILVYQILRVLRVSVSYEKKKRAVGTGLTFACTKIQAILKSPVIEPRFRQSLKREGREIIPPTPSATHSFPFPIALSASLVLTFDSRPLALTVPPASGICISSTLTIERSPPCIEPPGNSHFRLSSRSSSSYASQAVSIRKQVFLSRNTASLEEALQRS